MPPFSALFMKAAALGLCSVLLSGCGREEPPEADHRLAVTVTRPVPRDFAPSLELPGRIVARNDVAVTAEIQGRQLIAVMAEAGDTVRKGDALAEIEPDSSLYALDQSLAQLERARASLAGLKAQYEKAELELRRYEQLVRTKAVSRQSYEERLVQKRTARSAVLQAQAEVAQLQAGLSESRRLRGRARVAAPCDGLVTARSAEPGMTAGEAALFHIALNGILEAEVQASADEIASIRPGLSAVLQVEGHAQPLRATVRHVSPQLDAATNLGTARLALESSDALRIGAFAQCTLQLPAVHAAAALPESAVAFERQSAAVWVVGAQGQAMRQPVKTGSVHGGWVQILDGLNASDLVVLKAGSLLQEGEHVRTVQAGRSAGDRQ